MTTVRAQNKVMVSNHIALEEETNEKSYSFAFCCVNYHYDDV